MGEYVYVDYSNLFIEGQRVSAVLNRQVGSITDAMATRTIDYNYRIDIDQLYHFLAGVRPKDIQRAVLFGSETPDNQWLWALAQKAEFETITHFRNAANKEKRVDASLITELLRDAYKRGTTKDVFRLVAGDGDYIPAVQRLVDDGYNVEVLFWDHASHGLVKACTNFTSLTNRLDWLAA
ncbi:MAG: NYN domain-containing protein [Sulfitobacter sp.]